MAESITHQEYYRDWGKYGDDLVRRGETVDDLSWLGEWDSELERMNEGKRGRPFEFPLSLFRYCAKQMCSKNITYRMMEGGLRCILGAFGRKAPDHSTIEIRCSELEWPLEPPAYPKRITCAIDASGVSTTVRGEYLRDAYGLKRGFLKLHALVDADDDAIISYALTDSGTPDKNVALILVDSAVQKGYEIDKALLDAGYDYREIWVGLMERKIEPVINLRASDVHANGCLYKGQMIDEWKKLGVKAWKEKHDYGKRWRAECTFSDFKRMLGGFVRAKKLTRVVKEMSCKVWIHNEYKKISCQ